MNTTATTGDTVTFVKDGKTFTGIIVAIDLHVPFFVTVTLSAGNSLTVNTDWITEVTKPVVKKSKKDLAAEKLFAELYGV